MKKIQIISDLNQRSIKIKSQLLRKLNQSKTTRSNIIIVIGGDGFMLQTLKKNRKSKKLFYGINSGNYGFLMNKFSSKTIIKNLFKANTVTISPLEMIVRSGKNQKKKFLAINEVSLLLLRKSNDSLSIGVFNTPLKLSASSTKIPVTFD